MQAVVSSSKLVNLEVKSATWVLPFLLLILSSNAFAFERYNEITHYDRYFSKYSKRYFGPAFDWRHFKAQAIAESRLDPDATSRVGAKGLMQIMPKTFEEIRKQHSTIEGSWQDPRWNIAAGIYYDREIWKRWSPKRTLQDRIDFMFGSYNAGRSRILKAQRIAQRKGLDPHRWTSIVQTLPSVTRKRSRETIAYVEKIGQIKEVLR
ncbi:MAG: transglycosylase SLT domain-containing protein [bacterium]